MGGAAGTSGSAGTGARLCPVDMVDVPGGTFTLGAGAYPDAIELTLASFCMDKTEVTLGRYLECSNSGTCMAPFAGSPCTASLGAPEHPVNCVTPSQAHAYCAWATKRLPTEAEWEYAARGTEQRTYPWGAAEPANNLLNWCGTSGCEGDGFQFTAPVGQFPMGNTPLGISDMAGNLFELTSSHYCPYSDPGCDTSLIVARGGSWDDSAPTTFRTTYRWYLQDANFNTFTGFRCAR
jgi:formylglycine-generating enzyme required for sulfatase activity